MSQSPSLFSRAYIDGIYIPSGLLVIGTLIVKREWLPYAVAVAVALGTFKVWNNSESKFGTNENGPGTISNSKTGVKAVLKPAEFQNFELKEKTIISHNVAM
jgi:cytochrome-b5 reductase